MQKNITVSYLPMPITIARRKGTRHIRIALKSNGEVRLSVPYGVPEIAARAFLRQKATWILEHYNTAHIITDGAHIGKFHQLSIKNGSSSRSNTKITDTEIKITLAQSLPASSEKAQLTIKRACEKALLQQAERLLPQRLQSISLRTGISYNNLRIKKLKSRWGSCDTHNNIILNSYLIQLNWDIIDYVICHELAHTKFHHHQATFWELVENLYPDYKNARRKLKTKQTDIIVE